MFMTSCGGPNGCETITLAEIKESGKTCDGCRKAALFIEELGDDLDHFSDESELAKANQRGAEMWQKWVASNRENDELRTRFKAYVEAVKEWAEEQALRAIDIGHDPDDWAPCVGGTEELAGILEVAL